MKSAGSHDETCARCLKTNLFSTLNSVCKHGARGGGEREKRNELTALRGARTRNDLQVFCGTQKTCAVHDARTSLRRRVLRSCVGRDISKTNGLDALKTVRVSSSTVNAGIRLKLARPA